MAGGNFLRGYCVHGIMPRKHRVHEPGSIWHVHSRGNAGMKLFEDADIFLGDVQSGGSVATSGLDLLRGLGYDPIILIGQDRAYTGREIHSTGTHHNEKWLINLSRIINFHLYLILHQSRLIE